MGPAPKTWYVPKDPPPDFITDLKHWLIEYAPNVESLGDQELQKLVPMTNAREWLSGKLDLLRMLEQELKPVEWLAQGLWYEAGKTGPFDFDELYAIVGPSDDIAVDPPSQADERLNVRSKLDELLSRTLEVNEIVDKLKLSALIQKPAVRLNCSSSTVKLKRSVWAVLIGINYPTLRCAVTDAETMSEFLINRLSVPQDHITKLLARGREDRSASDHPTRHNILSKLWSLHQDERIRHGDTIIVFYAGCGTRYSSGGILRHGARVEESDLDWNSFYQRNYVNFEGPDDTSGHPLIDAIAPTDRGRPDPDPKYLGRTVPDICDRELNTIFTITRQKKGPNIVFIADCSHFAIPIRTTNPVYGSWWYRSLMPLLEDSMQNMLLRAQWNIDTYVKDGRSSAQRVMDVNWTPDTSSFVTLAACGRYERAKEHSTQGYGFFTGVLLDTLESDAVDKNTTFEGVIQLVAAKLRRWQVPVAHGDRKDSRL